MLWFELVSVFHHLLMMLISSAGFPSCFRLPFLSHKKKDHHDNKNTTSAMLKSRTIPAPMIPPFAASGQTTILLCSSAYLISQLSEPTAGLFFSSSYNIIIFNTTAVLIASTYHVRSKGIIHIMAG